MSNARQERRKDVMLCTPFEEQRLARWNPPYVVQPKFDGFRCRAVASNGHGPYTLLSSEGHVIISVPHINVALNKLQPYRFELDGELYVHGMPFEAITSRVKRTQNLHPDYTSIQFHVFDIVSNDPQIERTKAMEVFRGWNPWIVVSPYWICETLDDITRVFDHVVQKGYEGIIVRHHAAAYVRKRSNMIMKFKPRKEDAYPIVGFKPEKDQYGTVKEPHRLGAIICASDNGEQFDVGTGFKEAERHALWAERETLPGKTLHIKYQNLTFDRQVPRFSRFVEVM